MADDGRKYGSQNNDEQQQRDAYRTMDLRMAGADVLAAWLRGGPIDAVQERFGFDRAVLPRQNAPTSAGGEARNGIRKWALIMDPTSGQTHSVEVILDECTNVNWVHPTLVQNFHLETRLVDLVRHEVMTGDTFESSKLANVGWIGYRNQTGTNQFYVLPPTSTLQMVVCKDFIDAYGRNVFLDEDPRPAVGPAYVTFQATRTKEEERQIGVGRAEAREDLERLAREKEAREEKGNRESKDKDKKGKEKERSLRSKGSSSKNSSR